jgi:hypothetical protein
VEIDLASIDPGVHKSAIALWFRGALVFADDMPNVTVYRLAENLKNARVIVETPVLYPTKRKQHKDVRNLLAVADKLKALSVRPFGVSPSAWKGQVPKKIHGNRIFAELRREEILAIVCIENHNTIDAVGLGLWFLGRLGRGGR